MDTITFPSMPDISTIEFQTIRRGTFRRAETFIGPRRLAEPTHISMSFESHYQMARDLSLTKGRMTRDHVGRIVVTGVATRWIIT